MKTISTLGILIAFLTSCQMNWDSGGEEEFRENCEKEVNRLNNRGNEIESDAVSTCQCIFLTAKRDHPNYSDYLENRSNYIVGEVMDYCRAENKK